MQFENKNEVESDCLDFTIFLIDDWFIHRQLKYI